MENHTQKSIKTTVAKTKGKRHDLGNTELTEQTAI